MDDEPVELAMDVWLRREALCMVCDVGGFETTREALSDAHLFFEFMKDGVVPGNNVRSLRRADQAGA